MYNIIKYDIINLFFIKKIIWYNKLYTTNNLLYMSLIKYTEKIYIRVIKNRYFPMNKLEMKTSNISKFKNENCILIKLETKYLNEFKNFEYTIKDYQLKKWEYKNRFTCIYNEDW